MKRFFLRITYSVLFCSLSYILVVPIIYKLPLKANVKYGKGGYGHFYSRMAELDTTSNVDLLFLGSSHTYRNFDTEYFANQGVSSFNLGSSSQTPDITFALLNEYLEELNPQMIVYEVYPDMIFESRLESRIDLISNLPLPRFKCIWNLPKLGINEFNTAIVSFWDKMITKNFIENTQKGNDTYIQGGYVKNEGIREQFDKIESINIDLNHEGFDQFKMNIKFLEQKVPNVFLVFAPIPSDTYELYNKQIDTINQMYSELGVYKNYNGIALNDTLHFKDDDHLNHSGVQIFNKLLFHDIQKLLKEVN